MRILQRAGVHMGPDDLISEDGDTLAWIRSMQKKNIHSQIQGVLTQTGSPVYDLAQLASQQLATDINEEFNVRATLAWSMSQAFHRATYNNASG